MEKINKDLCKTGRAGINIKSWVTGAGRESAPHVLYLELGIVFLIHRYTDMLYVVLVS
jgi:hypothetical protein